MQNHGLGCIREAYSILCLQAEDLCGTCCPVSGSINTLSSVLVLSLKESAFASWGDVVGLRMKSSRELTQYLTYFGLNLFFDGSHVASGVKHEGLEPRK